MDFHDFCPDCSSAAYTFSQLPTIKPDKSGTF
jgi:hypothetical protein